MLPSKTIAGAEVTDKTASLERDTEGDHAIDQLRDQGALEKDLEGLREALQEARGMGRVLVHLLPASETGTFGRKGADVFGAEGRKEPPGQEDSGRQGRISWDPCLCRRRAGRLVPVRT